MGIAKVTRNYQVTIPRDIRVLQDIKVGDTVLFAIEGNKIDFLKMERKDSIGEVVGIWKDRGTGDEYTRKIRMEWKIREKRLGLK